MLIECKPYNPGGKVFVLVNKIQYFVQADRGSRIVLTEGREMLVGDWPEELAMKIKEAENE